MVTQGTPRFTDNLSCSQSITTKEDCANCLSMVDVESVGDKVQLYVYDLSQGFAAQVSQALLGKHVGDRTP